MKLKKDLIYQKLEATGEVVVLESSREHIHCLQGVSARVFLLLQEASPRVTIEAEIAGLSGCAEPDAVLDEVLREFSELHFLSDDSPSVSSEPSKFSRRHALAGLSGAILTVALPLSAAAASVGGSSICLPSGPARTSEACTALMLNNGDQVCYQRSFVSADGTCGGFPTPQQSTQTCGGIDLNLARDSHWAAGPCF